MYKCLHTGKYGAIIQNCWQSNTKSANAKRKWRFVTMILKPLFDKVVLEEEESSVTTASGIVLPTQAKEKPQMARVIAVGPGGIVDGKEIVMQVKVGDEVLYSKYAGSEFKLDEKKVTVLRQSDILAIVEK